MAEGIQRLGGKPEIYSTTDWPGASDGRLLGLPDVAVFYGLEGNLIEIFRYWRDQRRAAVYIDLGYWGRRQGGRWAGFHKVVVNARHPNAYFNAPQKGATRFETFDLHVQSMATRERNSDWILLGGMGDKGAAAEGFEPEEWERKTLATLKAVTDKPVIYRPKPSWKEAQPINGAGFSGPVEKIDWRKIWACVTHHSNLSVDALIEGVPSFCIGGAARILSGLAEPGPLRWIDAGMNVHRDVVEAWAHNLAWTQWSVDEMRRGLTWRHLLSENLL